MAIFANKKRNSIANLKAAFKRNSTASMPELAHDNIQGDTLDARQQAERMLNGNVASQEPTSASEAPSNANDATVSHRKARPLSYISITESLSNGRKARPLSYVSITDSLSMVTNTTSGKKSRPTSLCGPPISIDLRTIQTVVSEIKPAKPAKGPKEWTYETAISNAFKAEERAEMSESPVKQQKYYERAAELYRRALIIQPDDLDAKCNRARILFAVGSSIYSGAAATDALRESVDIYIFVLNNVSTEDVSNRVLEAKYNLAQALMELAMRICPDNLSDVYSESSEEPPQATLLRRAVKQLTSVANSQEEVHKQQKGSEGPNTVVKETVGMAVARGRASTSTVVDTLLSLCDACLSLALYVPLDQAEDAFLLASKALSRAKAANTRLPDALSVFRAFDLRLAWSSASLSRMQRIFTLNAPLDQKSINATLMDISNIVQQECEMASQPGALSGGKDRMLLAMLQLSEAELIVANLLRRDELREATIIAKAGSTGSSPPVANAVAPPPTASPIRRLSRKPSIASLNITLANTKKSALLVAGPLTPSTPGMLTSNVANLITPVSTPGGSDCHAAPVEPDAAHVRLHSRKMSAMAVDEALNHSLGPRKPSLIFNLASTDDIEEAGTRRSSTSTRGSRPVTEEKTSSSPSIASLSWLRRRSSSSSPHMQTPVTPTPQPIVTASDPKISEHLVAAQKVLQAALALLPMSRLPAQDLAATRTRLLLNISRTSLLQSQLSVKPSGPNCLGQAEMYAAWASRIVGWEWILDGRPSPTEAEVEAQQGGWRVDSLGFEAIFRLIRTWYYASMTSTSSNNSSTSTLGSSHQPISRERESIERLLRNLREKKADTDEDLLRFIMNVQRSEGELPKDEKDFWRRCATVPAQVPKPVEA